MKCEAATKSIRICSRMFNWASSKNIAHVFFDFQPEKLLRMFELAQTKMKGEKIRICIRFPFPIQTVSGWLSKTM